MVERLNDRYELHDLLGAGGMGRVHSAHDLRLDREVAVKILRGDRVGDDDARARLRAEARTAGRLNHPGIATVHDYGEDEASDDGDPFIVMQRVDGTSLSELLRDVGTLRPADVERLLRGVADALAAAHDAGVVHRDVKPSNIVLTADARPVLLDFGIALGASREALTETGAILGTAEYISPEQARGETATPASDVYSLGLVAHQCLTGTSPFRRETSVATALAQVGEDLPPLPSSVPATLARLVASMADKDPGRRPTAAQVRDSLEEGPVEATAVLDGVDVPTDALPAAVVAAPPPPRRAGARALLARSSRRSRVFAGVGGLAALLLFLGLVEGLPGGSPVRLPDVVGVSAEKASDQLADLGARVTLERVDDPTTPEGVVVEQSPKADATLPDDDVVTLQVATGRMDVPGDDLVGRPVADVRAELEKRGFVVETKEVSSGEDAGTVVALDRSGRLPIGETVVLSVAQAPSATSAPATSSSSSSSDSGGSASKGPAAPQDPSTGPGSGKGAKGKGEDNGKGAKGKGQGPAGP